MKKTNFVAGKAGKIIYWIATVWLSLGMLSTGIVQLLRVNGEIEFILQLGYPDYFLTLLGIWKILGVVALLLPATYYRCRSKNQPWDSSHEFLISWNYFSTGIRPLQLKLSCGPKIP